MHPSLLQIILLGLIQGAAELLPVSSSAHVIVAEKLMGLDPSSPAMTFLLVMLHTGTMMAVILYFWKSWKKAFFANKASSATIFKQILFATLVTGAVGLILKTFVEHFFLKTSTGSHGQIEDLFSRLPLLASALFFSGCIILWSARASRSSANAPLSDGSSLWIGAAQGLCLPFRGLSRSGLTISTGLLNGIGHRSVEEFSFALAVIITPPALIHELHRLIKDVGFTSGGSDLVHLFGPGLLGAFSAFLAGLAALRLLSNLLSDRHWGWFGWYCFAFSGFVIVLSLNHV